MKVLLKKGVYESCEQCTGPTDKHIPVKILLVKEVVGPVHSAQARQNLTWNALLIKKKKKKKKDADKY